jgi:hypothetical protein
MCNFWNDRNNFFVLDIYMFIIQHLQQEAIIYYILHYIHFFTFWVVFGRKDVEEEVVVVVTVVNDVLGV